MKKILLFRKVNILFLVFFLLIPLSVFATNSQSEQVFKAKVISILEQKEKDLENDQKLIQQNIKLIGLDGRLKQKEFIFYGIGDIEIIGGKVYSPGDIVLVTESFNSEDQSYNYYITDYVRSNNLILILAVFLFFLLLIGRWKGFRSILSLFLTFLVIIFFIIPQIISGINPVLVVMVGSVFILFFIIYLTEGFNLVSHLASLSIFISLILVVMISWLFIFLTKLTGAFNEDVFVLINIGQQAINLKGMLLAGMIVGALGVLDDVVISQIVSVEQIVEANPYQSWKEVYKKAYKIGVSHISSMTNTLFLAYAGASLPILMLFADSNSPFSSFEQIINNEAISTEIVRALSGSLGIILSVPIATFLAAKIIILKKRKV